MAPTYKFVADIMAQIFPVPLAIVFAYLVSASISWNLWGMLPLFFLLSPASRMVKVYILAVLNSAFFYFMRLQAPEDLRIPNSSLLKVIFFLVIVRLVVQTSARYLRISQIKKGYRITSNPASWKAMTVDQAQDIGKWLLFLAGCYAR